MSNKSIYIKNSKIWSKENSLNNWQNNIEKSPIQIITSYENCSPLTSKIRSKLVKKVANLMNRTKFKKSQDFENLSSWNYFWEKSSPLKKYIESSAHKEFMKELSPKTLRNNKKVLNFDGERTIQEMKK